MLFLGAGASAAFGVPTLQRLTEEAEVLLIEKGLDKALIENIKKALAEFGLTWDFESLLTILEAFARPSDSIRVAGPFAAYLSHRMSNPLPVIENAEDYIKFLKRLLVEKCTAADIANATVAYQRLFESLFAAGNVRVVDDLGRQLVLPYDNGFQDSARRMRTQDIFTLNYDLVIEKVFQDLHLESSLVNGFQAVGMNFLWRPKNTYHVPPPPQNVTNLIKMHGSIDQFVRRDGEIEKRQAPPDIGYYTSESLEEMMIFPVHEKYITRSPYFDLYNLLRRRLENDPLCIVIGYSFRDEAVNNAFIDGAKLNRRLKFIYIGGKSAERTIDLVPQIKNRTKVHNWSFDSQADTLREIGGLSSDISSWYPS
jgi:hypothetical protein